MARSEIIWTVTRFGRPEAAFTVKHELVTWLGNQSDTCLMDATIWRMVDNPNDSSPTPQEVPLGSL